MAPAGGVCVGDLPTNGRLRLVFFVWLATVAYSDGSSNTGGRDCDETIISEITKNGTFTSPLYPRPYPPNKECHYQFEGNEDERVQILFTDFDLHMAQEKTKECEGVDSVVVFIEIHGHKERVDNFCGNTLPPQLMSNGPKMTVQFRSNHHVPSEVKGFRAIYRFVTNFGITAGKQESKMNCVFLFNSTERSNGTFTSPNWPGYYPRDTECEYLFFGSSNERVHITFAYFDVDGVPPCGSDTASDYVEFSNFRTVDRKIPKHCGIRVPKIVESDSDFFRVTFKSNDKFDGTGFEAFYQFRTFVDPYTVKRISPSSAGTVSFLRVHEMAALMVFLKAYYSFMM